MNNRATKEEIYKLFGDLYEMRLEKNTFVTQTQEVAETHSVMMMVMMKMGMMVMQTMAAFMVQIYDGFAPQSYVPAQCSVMHLCAVLSILKILPCSPARTKSEVAINVFLLNMRIALISFFYCHIQLIALHLSTIWTRNSVCRTYMFYSYTLCLLLIVSLEFY